MATTRALRAPYGVTRGEFPIPPLQAVPNLWPGPAVQTSRSSPIMRARRDEEGENDGCDADARTGEGTGTRAVAALVCLCGWLVNQHRRHRTLLLCALTGGLECDALLVSTDNLPRREEGAGASLVVNRRSGGVWAVRRRSPERLGRYRMGCAIAPLVYPDQPNLLSLAP